MNAHILVCCVGSRLTETPLLNKIVEEINLEIRTLFISRKVQLEELVICIQDGQVLSPKEVILLKINQKGWKYYTDEIQKIVLKILHDHFPDGPQIITF